MSFYFLMGLSFCGALLKVMWEFVLILSSIIVLVAAFFFFSHFDLQITKRSVSKVRPFFLTQEIGSIFESKTIEAIRADMKSAILNQDPG